MNIHFKKKAWLFSVGMLSLFILSNSAFAVAKHAQHPHSLSVGEKTVTVYLLIDDLTALNRYTTDLALVTKPNFNRVVFSFIKPTMPDYVSGDLSNTGILGYFGVGDGKGPEAFVKLKEAVALSKAKNLQTFVSVGGWNYSCNYDVYGKSCGAAPSDTIKFDWFPDPLGYNP